MRWIIFNILNFAQNIPEPQIVRHAPQAAYERLGREPKKTPNQQGSSVSKPKIIGWLWMTCMLFDSTNVFIRQSFDVCTLQARRWDCHSTSLKSCKYVFFFFGNMVMCGHNVDIRRHNISVPGQISYLSWSRMKHYARARLCFHCMNTEAFGLKQWSMMFHIDTSWINMYKNISKHSKKQFVP